MTKSELRKKMRSKRSAISALAKKSYDELIGHRIKKIIEDNNFKVIHLYLPMNNEINLTHLIDDLHKAELKIICPKTLKNRALEHLVYFPGNDIENGLFDTKYPRSETIYYGPLDLIVVPGLAFDNDNYRLGYGGGYYDSFLTEHDEAYQLGVAYPFQIVEELPREKHDAQLDKVLYFTDL